MILRFRYLYRRILLAFIPARAYVLKPGIESHEIKVRLAELIQSDKLYFLYGANPTKLYNGKFGSNFFVAIKNNPSGIQRPIKVRGQFFFQNQEMYVKITMSNPFSLINIGALALLYFVLLVLFKVYPLSPWYWNAVFYLVPLAATYILTNISFQRTYRIEKSRFFKLFEARRVSDAETRRIMQKS